MRLGFRSLHAQIFLGFGMCFLVLCNFFLSPGYGQVNLQNTAEVAPIQLTQNWQYSGQNPFNSTTTETLWQPLEINEIISIPPEQEMLWLRVLLPEVDLDMPYFYVRGIPHLLDVYLGSQKIYTDNRLTENKDIVPSHNVWSIIALPWREVNADYLYFQVYVGNQDYYHLVAADPPIIGAQVDLVRRIILKNISKVALGFFFILCGLFPLIFSLFKQNQKIYRAFGLLCFTVGIYTITKIESVRLLLGDADLIYYIHFISFYFTPFTVGYFFEKVFSDQKSKFVRRLWQIMLLSALISLFLLFSRVVPIPQTFYLTQFFGIFGSLILIAIAIRYARQGSFEAKLFTIGFSLFLLFAVYDVINYVFAANNDGTSFYDWGLLVFITFLAIMLERRFTEANRQLKQYATQLQEKNQKLQELNQLKDEFLANTSHELRTPLNGIIGIAESLMEGVTGELPDPTISNLSLIVYSGRRLTQLVNDLQDFSQLQHQNITLSLKPVGLREMTEIVLKISQPLVGNKSIQLINDIPPNTPLVDADENRIQQILSNLVGNGIKFTESGEVRVSRRVVDGFLEITVSDTGIGIPSEKFERIFAVFEQGDGSISRKYGGMGLGLAISKQLIELHQGTIRVESEVNRGSKFIFTVPISNSQVAIPSTGTVSRVLVPRETSENQPISTPTAITENQGSFNILIVDDDPVNRQVLLNYLALENYIVTQAEDGLEALNLLEQGYRPDLILLDIMMPQMTGYEACQRIRSQYSSGELPIVLLTAKIQVSDLVEGFDSGANDYLTKPISKKELLARLKTHLRLAKVNIAYGRFVPHEFLKFLHRDSIVEVKLGDQVQQKMSVLFSDIRSFTTLSESMSPKDNFDFLNSYLGRVGPIIRNHQGFVDKYIGDAVMALFPETADYALQAGIEMQKCVGGYNTETRENHQPAIAIGIGIHTGNLMLGTIGEEQRMESTVISDAVNLASRLEGLTKTYGADLIISDRTLLSLTNPEEYYTRFLGSVRVKGKRQPVSIFEVYDADGDRLKTFKQETKDVFEQAVLLFQDGNFREASLIFQELQQQNSQDRVIQLYLERSLTINNV